LRWPRENGARLGEDRTGGDVVHGDPTKEYERTEPRCSQRLYQQTAAFDSPYRDQGGRKRSVHARASIGSESGFCAAEFADSDAWRFTTFAQIRGGAVKAYWPFSAFS